MNHILGATVEGLPGVLSLTDPFASAKVCPSKMKKNVPPPTQVKVYACSAPGLTPDRFPLLHPKKNSVSIAEHNDNAILGLIPGGNDTGDTHGLDLTGVWVNHQGTWTLQIGSHLYTREADIDFQGADAADNAIYQGNAFTSENHSPYSDERIPIQFEDVTRFRLSLERGEDIFYRVAVEVDSQQTDPKRFTPAVDIQNMWHGMPWMYKFADMSAEGVPATYWIDKHEVEVPEMTYRSDLGPIKIPTHKEMLPVANYTYGILPNTYLKKLPKWSFLIGGDVGKRKEVFDGKCELQVEAGGFIATNGKDIFGPDTYVHLKGTAMGTLIRHQNHQPLLNAGANTEILYFPKVDAPGEKNLGFAESLRLETSHRLGKKGARLSPFIVVTAPIGRNNHQYMNDNDKITRFGFKVTFK